MLRLPGLRRPVPRRVGSAVENPLTFNQGLTRAGDTITNDLITGKAGGQTVIGGTGPAENLTLQSTTSVSRGYVVSADPFGIGRAPGSLGFPPQFAIAGNVQVASAANAGLDYIIVNTPAVTVTGSTNITNALGFNFFTLQPPAITTTVTIGAGGAIPASSTVTISGVPTISGGGAFAGTVGPVGLWVQGAAATSAVFDGTTIVNGATLIVNGANGIVVNGANGIAIAQATTTLNLSTTSLLLTHSGAQTNWDINTTTTNIDIRLLGNGTECFRVKGNGGAMQLGPATIAANGTGAGLGFGSVAPLGAHVTPQEWLTVLGSVGTQRWIPMF